MYKYAYTHMHISDLLVLPLKKIIDGILLQLIYIYKLQICMYMYIFIFMYIYSLLIVPLVKHRTKRLW